MVQEFPGPHAKFAEDFVAIQGAYSHWYWRISSVLKQATVVTEVPMLLHELHHLEKALANAAR